MNKNHAKTFENFNDGDKQKIYPDDMEKFMFGDVVVDRNGDILDDDIIIISGGIATVNDDGVVTIKQNGEYGLINIHFSQQEIKALSNLSV